MREILIRNKKAKREMKRKEKKETFFVVSRRRWQMTCGAEEKK
jgi:hypothetical protein